MANKDTKLIFFYHCWLPVSRHQRQIVHVVHCSKRLAIFSSPAGMSLIKHSLASRSLSCFRLPTASVEGEYVQSHLHPIRHTHGQLLRKKVALCFLGSCVKLKKIEKTKYENVTRSQEFLEKARLENDARSQRDANSRECRLFMGRPSAPSSTFSWQQFLHFFCQILRSYTTSSQCYEGNIFLMPFLPFSYYTYDHGWLVMQLSTKNTRDRGRSYIMLLGVCIVDESWRRLEACLQRSWVVVFLS